MFLRLLSIGLDIVDLGKNFERPRASVDANLLHRDSQYSQYLHV